MSIVSHVQFFKPWFNFPPQNAVKSTATIGSGDNGVVTVTHYIAGTQGNDLSIEVVEGVGANIGMSAVFANSKLTVTLGTGAGATLDNAKNTALLISAAIDALDEFSAVKSGTGVTALTEAEVEKSFTGGQYATPAMTDCFILDGSTWYIASKPVNKSTTDGWYSMTLTIV